MRVFHFFLNLIEGRQVLPKFVSWKQITTIFIRLPGMTLHMAYRSNLRFPFITPLIQLRCMQLISYKNF